jgi:predicted ATP-grasp superfamily ATP-dependent carboligase
VETVIVLGTDSPIGLAVIRDLGRHGFTVTGVGSHKHSLGLMSRYCARAVVRNPDPDELIKQLVELATGAARTFLISIGESDVNLVNQHRSQLSRHLTLLDPNAEQMAKVLDKSQTLEIAQQVGIDTPRSHQIDQLDQMDLLRPQLEFPVILKWSNPHLVYQGLKEHGVELLKLEYCQTFEELATALSKYRALGQFPLIQHYCAGYGLGQFFLCRQGRSLLEFQHKRLNEWPPEGGSSTLCQALPPGHHSDCMEKSRQLLEALKWDGVAMVEYRFDPQAKRYWLMEINGRFWGSLPLATRSEVGFASSLVNVIGKQSSPFAPATGGELKSRYMIPEIKRLLRIVLHPEKIGDPFVKFSRLREIGLFLAYFFDPACRFYVFEWNDPWPFFSDMRNAAKKTLRQVLRRDSANTA